MKSPRPVCGRPWLGTSCHSLSYGILFWQKASGCMFSFPGKHPRQLAFQFVISMPFHRLASFPLHMSCGHGLLLLMRGHALPFVHTKWGPQPQLASLKETMGKGQSQEEPGTPSAACGSYFFSLMYLRAGLSGKRESTSQKWISPSLKFLFQLFLGMVCLPLLVILWWRPAAACSQRCAVFSQSTSSCAVCRKAGLSVDSPDTRVERKHKLQLF